MKKSVTLLAISATILSACAGGMGQKQMLSDTKIAKSTAGMLGVSAESVTISERNSQGVNTYYKATTSSGQTYNCVINGGSVLSLGMTNAPNCAKPGEPLKAPGFN